MPATTCHEVQGRDESASLVTLACPVDGAIFDVSAEQAEAQVECPQCGHKAAVTEPA
jgi:DNA-directed RNA polymerase subunit RPC12/RpoP